MANKIFALEDVKAALDWEGGVLEMHADGDWISEGKYECATHILKETATGDFFSVNDYRSGSYHSDWYYDSEDWTGPQELNQVEWKSVTIAKWVDVV